MAEGCFGCCWYLLSTATFDTPSLFDSLDNNPKVIFSSVGSLSCSLLPIGYNYHHQAALVPMSTSLLSDYAQLLIFQKNLKGGGTAVCAVLLVRVIPHHTFVLPALIGHISTPDVVSGYTTRGRTFGNRNQT